MDNTLSSLYIYGQNYISHCCMRVCLWFCFLFLNIRLLDHFSAVERNIQAPCFSDYQRDERSLIYQLGAKLCLELGSSYSSPSVGRAAHTQELPGALSSPWHCARHWKIRWRECSQTLPFRSHFAPSLKQRKKIKESLLVRQSQGRSGPVGRLPCMLRHGPIRGVPLRCKARG